MIVAQTLKVSLLPLPHPPLDDLSHKLQGHRLEGVTEGVEVAKDLHVLRQAHAVPQQQVPLRYYVPQLLIQGQGIQTCPLTQGVGSPKQAFHGGGDLLGSHPRGLKLPGRPSWADLAPRGQDGCTGHKADHHNHSQIGEQTLPRNHGHNIIRQLFYALAFRPQPTPTSSFPPQK